MTSRNRTTDTGEVQSRTSGVLEKPLLGSLVAGVERQLDKLSSSPLAPALYLVSTPIGNLADISIRALHTLMAADIVLCEDTRHSRKLLSAYGIDRRVQSYHDFSREKDRLRILASLHEGKAVALVSDAGTPLISDPGFKLVRSAVEQSVPVLAIPGASAVLAALTTSALPPDRFFFGGFLPAKEAARRETLRAALALPCTAIFYETSTRIEGALEDIVSEAPARPTALARELTKLHETAVRGKAVEVLEFVREEPPRGELVLVIGAEDKPAAAETEIEAALRQALADKSLKEAVESVSKGLGVGRKRVYNLALKMRER